MRALVLASSFAALLLACGDSGSGGGGKGGSGGAADGGSNNGGNGTGGNVQSGGAGTGGSVPLGEIGTWQDAPGACPDGSVRADITTADEMASAARGETHTDATCFFVHDGEYVQSGGSPLLYFLRGGTAAQPIVWVGESRSGVVVRSRATFEHSVDGDGSHMVLSNMTFDISTLTDSGSYNTISVLASDIVLSHLTLTGDCQHGARGGHIEVTAPDDATQPTGILIDSCLIENFGRCGTADGALDHGIYLSAGDDLVVRNNVIQGNSSRGIQVYTHYEDISQTIDGLLVEQNRILENGHGDYQDGMVINGDVGSGFDGPLMNVTIRNNIFYRNHYSAIRFVGNAVTGVDVSHNTFVEDGQPSSSANRSEINLDEGTPEATISKNIFVLDNVLTNDCSAALSIDDNIASGGTADGTCVTNTQATDPQLADPANGDFHAGAPAAAGYGAYSQ
ncbi:MAG: right-handed parallel beta-helix repeat-containing protein [Polyangiaceae bacterium]